MSSEIEILREKIHEAQYNGLMGFGLLVLGLAVAFAGLFLATITETRLIVQSYVLSHPYVQLSLAITLLGLLMTVLGCVMVLYSEANRSESIKKLEWISCPKCGGKHEKTSKYCPYCGTQLMNLPYAIKAEIREH